MDGIVFSLEEEGGRGVGAGVDSFCELGEGWGFGEVGGIDDDDEVGTGAMAASDAGALGRLKSA